MRAGPIGMVCLQGSSSCTGGCDAILVDTIELCSRGGALLRRGRGLSSRSSRLLLGGSGLLSLKASLTLGERLGGAGLLHGSGRRLGGGSRLASSLALGNGIGLSGQARLLLGKRLRLGRSGGASDLLLGALLFGRLFHGLIERVHDLGLDHLVHLVLGLTELPQRTADGATHGGKPVRTEDEEAEYEDDRELGTTDS